MSIKIVKKDESSTPPTVIVEEKENLAGYSPLDKLPSKFIPYDTKVIYVRPFNLGEIEDLNSIRVFDIRVFLDTIKDIVKGMDINELTVIDLKTSLLYSLILSSDNSIWNMTVTCEECDTKYVRQLTISDLHFQDLEVQGLPLETDDDELKGVYFDVFRVKHILEMDSYSKQHPNAKLTSLTRAVLSNIRPLDKAYAFFRNASPKISKSLVELESLLIHGIDPVKCRCTNHAKAIMLENENDQDLLLNEFKSLKPIRNFGVSVPSNEPELVGEIQKFIVTNEINAKPIECGHVQETEVELNLGSFFPEDFYR